MYYWNYSFEFKIVTNVIEEPETVIAYFKYEIIEKIEYKDTDMWIDLVNDGIYCFMVTDKDGGMVDITSKEYRILMED